MEKKTEKNTCKIFCRETVLIEIIHLHISGKMIIHT